MINLTALSMWFENRDIWDDFGIRITVVDISKLNNLIDLSLYLNDNSVDNNAFEEML